MLDRDRLALALDIHARSYKLLKWIGAAIDEGRIPAGTAARHSDDPTAANEWIDSNYGLIPEEIRPERHHLHEFANFFWTYITTSFDVVEQPGVLMSPGGCGCSCPMCARIINASHLKPKKLSRSDKRRAMDLMVDRILVLANEHNIEITPTRAREVVSTDLTRRSAGYSTYGYWLIQRLDGYTDGPAVLALWREIAWSRMGSPIQGFRLRLNDFVDAETAIVESLTATEA